jgi:uncharacterized membrane protein YdjX (TVP38/TMEM64 family)
MSSTLSPVPSPSSSRSSTAAAASAIRSHPLFSLLLPVLPFIVLIFLVYYLLQLLLPASILSFGIPSSLASARSLLSLIRSEFHLSPFTLNRDSLSLLLSFSLVYLFKQCFSIPGSLILNLLAGALFPSNLAFPLVSVLTALGASLAYSLSLILSRTLLASSSVISSFLSSGRVDQLRSSLRSLSNDPISLFLYLLSARLFPFTPTWFLNLASPLVGIPYIPFTLSVLLGLAPYNFLTVSSGAFLASLESPSEILQGQSLIRLVGLTGFALGLAVLKRRNMGKQAGIIEQNQTTESNYEKRE